VKATTAIATWLRLVARLVIAVAMYVLCVAELGLMKVASRLDKGPLPASKIIGRAIKAREARSALVVAKSPTTRPDGVSGLLKGYIGWLSGMDDAKLDRYRWHWESEFGVSIKDKEQNPHLYAVLIPTKRENLLRVVNCMGQMDPAYLVEWLTDIMPLLKETS